MARKLLLALVVLPTLLILGLVVFLKLSDFSGWRGTVARLASERIGREITISGRFEADVGGITRLVVEDVALANPDWSTERVMAQADRLEIFESLAGLRLPSEPVAVEGHLGYRGDTLALESVVVRAAESRVRLDGILRPSSRFAGTDSWLALSTGGLSWAAEGLWKRLADRKLCKKALKVATKARAAIQAGGHDHVQ